jgi:hypothetical protein
MGHVVRTSTSPSLRSPPLAPLLYHRRNAEGRDAQTVYRDKATGRVMSAEEAFKAKVGRPRGGGGVGSRGRSPRLAVAGSANAAHGAFL